MEKVIEEYENRLEKLRSNPIIKFLEKGDFEILESELNTLKNEIEGMKKYSNKWKEQKDHPETHFEAIQTILEGLD